MLSNKRGRLWGVINGLEIFCEGSNLLYTEKAGKIGPITNGTNRFRSTTYIIPFRLLAVLFDFRAFSIGLFFFGIAMNKRPAIQTPIVNR